MTSLLNTSLSASPAKPLLPDVGVIGLVYHHWGSRWLTPHHVFARLGRYFHVVWVNPAHEWREIPERLKEQMNRPGEGHDSPGFHVYRPEWWLPKFFRPQWLADFTFDQRLRKARQALIKQGCKKIVLYMWDFRYERALSSSLFDLSCYHIEDEYSFSTVEAPVDPSEARVISMVDEVFIISPAMMEKKGKINLHTTLISHGVDYKAYATPAPEPMDIASIPHPRIGYSGFLKKQLDWSLLLQLATMHPEWSFVFVGAQKHDEIGSLIGELSRRPNVYFLGAKPVKELAYYPQHFDACIMPYQMDDYTKFIFPLKLYEYLASGRPVVGSPIRSLLDYAHVVKLARTPEEWSEALTSSLAPRAGSDEQAKIRCAVAQENDWSAQIYRLAYIVSSRLGQTYKERLKKIPMEEA